MRFGVSALVATVVVCSAAQAQSGPDVPTVIPPGFGSTPRFEQEADVLCFTTAPFTEDWSGPNGLDCVGLLDAAFNWELGNINPNNPTERFNARRTCDPNFGNKSPSPGKRDPSLFDGMSNKNNDLIGLGDPQWTWKGGKGGPQKNDITNNYLFSFREPDDAQGNPGDLWLCFGVETRSPDGNSHVDLEFNQAGVLICSDPFGLDCAQESGELGGLTSGFLIGQGPDGGRTVDDFIISMDFNQGGVQPVPELRMWDGTSFGGPISTNGFFIKSNESDITPGGPWGHFEKNGNPSPNILNFQFVEGAVNLTEAGAEPSLCIPNSSATFKSRSSQEFTATLKDFAIVLFPLAPEPPELSAPPVLCEDFPAQLIANVTADSQAPYTVEWFRCTNADCTSSEPACTGVGGLCVDSCVVDAAEDCTLQFNSAQDAVEGTYFAIATDANGCESEPVFLKLTLKWETETVTPP